MKKLVLITGASSGIGKAIALRLSKENYYVLLHYNKNRVGADGTLKTIAELDGQGDIVGFDVRDSKSIELSLEEWFKVHPDFKLDALVSNAGIHIDNLAGMMSDEAFDDVMKTNAYGSFYLMRFAVRRMLRNRSGSIVNISSLSGQVGNVGQINYAASKAALIAMTKTLAMEVGPRGVRVNAVAPGLIETEMIEKIPEIEKLKERIPLRRCGTPDEVAGVVSFLLSQDASYITGHTISVNGGLFPS